MSDQWMHEQAGQYDFFDDPEVGDLLGPQQSFLSDGDEGGLAAGLGAMDGDEDDDIDPGGIRDYMDMSDDEIDEGLDDWTDDDQARWDAGERW